MNDKLTSNINTSLLGIVVAMIGYLLLFVIENLVEIKSDVNDMKITAATQQEKIAFIHYKINNNQDNIDKIFNKLENYE